MALQETIAQALPTVNATLNSLSGLLLMVGFIMIKSGRRVAAHKFAMLSACGVSVAFLACYLLRVALTGTHRFPGQGFWRTVYLFILTTHMLQAMLVPFLAARAVQLGFKGRYPEHRALVRYLFPMWMYVSVTGVVVYLMLYHWPAS